MQDIDKTFIKILIRFGFSVSILKREEPKEYQHMIHTSVIPVTWEAKAGGFQV
jgi:hypothetical protein